MTAFGPPEGIRHAVITPAGDVTEHTSLLPLARMQEIVGGYIDVVAARGPKAPEGLWLVVNDDGLLDSQPVNVLAGELYYATDYPVEARYGIRGDVIAVRIDFEGDTISITDNDVARIDTLRKALAS